MKLIQKGLQARKADFNDPESLLSWDNVSDENIDRVYEANNIARGVSNDKTGDTVAGLKNLFRTFSWEEQYHHTAKQAHIAFSIAAAAVLGVDTTPKKEGFDKSVLDEFLNLKEKGLRSVVLLALGKRKEEGNWYLSLKKIVKLRENSRQRLNSLWQILVFSIR